MRKRRADWRPGGRQFARYEAKLSRGWANKLSFTVNSVSGVYAEWSPDIKARHLKILTGSKEHNLRAVGPTSIVPGRLGRVYASTLHVHSLTRMVQEG